MFCTNCGQRFEGKFCPTCGTCVESSSPSIPALREPYYMDFGGTSIDVNKVIRMYGLGIRKSGAYTLISEKTGVPVSAVKQALEPVLQYHKSNGEKTGLLDGAKAQLSMELSTPHSASLGKQDRPVSKRQRIHENKKNAVACCPKCGSSSLSANKKGFGFGKAALGVWAAKVPGAVVGSIGSKKVEVTCLNCGHRWKL